MVATSRCRSRTFVSPFTAGHGRIDRIHEEVATGRETSVRKHSPES